MPITNISQASSTTTSPLHHITAKNNVAAILKRNISTEELCDALQNLGHEHQADIRNTLRENHKLQKALGIGLDDNSDITSLPQLKPSTNATHIDIAEIKKSIWLIGLLIADTHEHYPDANQRLHQGLIALQKQLAPSAKNPDELLQKQIALEQLAEQLSQGAFNDDHRALVQTIIMQSASTSEINGSAQFKEIMYQKLVGHVPTKILAETFPGRLENDARNHFKSSRSLSYRSLHELARPIDEKFGQALNNAKAGNMKTAVNIFNSIHYEDRQRVVTPEDKQLISQTKSNPEELKQIVRNAQTKADDDLNPLERAAKHKILDNLLGSQSEIVMEKLHSLYTEWKTQYSPANNGEYPIRDSAGNKVRITHIHAESLDGQHGNSKVKPFISSTKTNEERAALYDEYLLVRPFVETDQRHPNEKSLVGQNTVVAKQEIRAGQCLGVYGGKIRNVESTYKPDGVYLINISLDQNVMLDGDNVLSRINTLFQYDDDGKIEAQADSGYNVKFVIFRITLEKAIEGHKEIALQAVFAQTDIQAGEELRIDYLYDKATINGILG